MAKISEMFESQAALEWYSHKVQVDQNNLQRHDALNILMDEVFQSLSQSGFIDGSKFSYRLKGFNADVVTDNACVHIQYRENSFYLYVYHFLDDDPSRNRSRHQVVLEMCGNDDLHLDMSSLFKQFKEQLSETI